MMQRLRYPQKFVLISVLFSVPIALLLYLYLSEIGARIAFAQRERDGVAYLQPLRSLLDHALQPELAVRAAATPLGVDTQIEADLQALATIDAQLGARLGTSADLAELNAVWQAFQAQGASAQAPDGQPLYTKLLASITALIATVGDQSNLILDPDLDTYYLMDMVLLKLPEAQQLIAELRLRGEQLAGDPALAAGGRAQILILRGMIATNSDEVDRNAELVLRNTIDPQIQPAIGPALASYRSAIDRYLQASVNLAQSAAPGSSDRVAYADLATAAERASFALWDAAAASLDTLLASRVERFNQRRALALGVTGVVLVLVCLVWIVFYRALLGTVGQLAQAAERMSGGQLGGDVKIEGRDELAEVVRSFNSVAAALVASSIQRQAVLDHAVDGIVTLSEEGVILSSNPAAEQLFGLRSAALNGMHLAQLIPPPYSEQFREVGAKHFVLGRRADGSEVPLNLAIGKMMRAEAAEYILIAHDMTELQRASEERAQLQEQVIAAQSRTLAELSNPVIPISAELIVMPLVGALDTTRIAQMQAALLRGIERQHATTAIIDITGVPVIDVQVANGLLRAVDMGRLCGSRVMITGIQPEVAQTMVSLGLDLSGLTTYSTLQSGITYAMRR